jgi:signal transduction histidine kinase
MKFLSKINRQYLLTLVLLLVLASIIGYFLLSKIIKHEVNEDIQQKEAAIIQEIQSQDNLIQLYPLIETKKIQSEEKVSKTYKEIYIYDEDEKDVEPFLEYTNSVKINGQWYLIKLRHSLWESNDLIIAIAFPLLLLLVLMLALSFLLTKKLNQSLWRNFEDNLKLLENYSFQLSDIPQLKNTGIEEFERMNKTILSMTDKLHKDYQSLKDFTENASHEIQTPLSIVLLNLEEVIQQNHSEETFKQLVSSINAIKRLSTLNQNLILLTKIENRQFPAKKAILFNKIVQQKIQEYAPLIEKQKLKVDLKLDTNFSLVMNEQLAFMLVNNLLSNAIKHNFAEGKISIETQTNLLKICNTGKPNQLNNSTIFNRFSKGDSQSYGLGLSIVKHICDTHQLSIQYAANQNHCFTIQVKKTIQ